MNTYFYKTSIFLFLISCFSLQAIFNLSLTIPDFSPKKTGCEERLKDSYQYKMLSNPGEHWHIIFTDDFIVKQTEDAQCMIKASRYLYGMASYLQCLCLMHVGLSIKDRDFKKTAQSIVIIGGLAGLKNIFIRMHDDAAQENYDVRMFLNQRNQQRN